MVNVIANILLIPFYSANGAALATVIAEFSVMAVQMNFVRSTIRRRQLFRSSWRYFLGGLVMFLVVNRICDVMTMNIVNMAIQIFVGTVIYVACLFILKAPVIEQAKQVLGK